MECQGGTSVCLYRKRVGVNPLCFFIISFVFFFSLFLLVSGSDFWWFYLSIQVFSCQARGWKDILQRREDKVYCWQLLFLYMTMDLNLTSIQLGGTIQLLWLFGGETINKINAIHHVKYFLLLNIWINIYFLF